MDHVSAGEVIPEWRLVPHDNNIGLRNVHPVAAALTGADVRSRRFWLRNPLDRTVQEEMLEAQLPGFVSERGWQLGFASAGGATFSMKPGAIKEIVPQLSAGKPFDRASLPKDPAERSIVITAQADGIPLGGMTYVIDADSSIPTPAANRTSTAAGRRRRRRQHTLWLVVLACLVVTFVALLYAGSGEPLFAAVAGSVCGALIWVAVCRMRGGLGRSR